MVGTPSDFSVSGNFQIHSQNRKRIKFNTDNQTISRNRTQFSFNLDCTLKRGLRTKAVNSSNPESPKSCAADSFRQLQ